MADEDSRGIHGSEQRGEAFLRRLLTRRVGAMLVRNTIVSTGVFLIGLWLLWFLVSWCKVDEVLATGIGFVVANSLHYALGRLWIFSGTTRGVTTGFGLFLANSALGLAITVSLFALLMDYTTMHYLIARIVVSVFAGLAMFVMNAALNFRLV